ncbi:hypothetical protein F3Y22_tig00111718pilonHSYRG00052 [Hibiscus syriacus]|uniref:Uncharacterized protein n=1 Tax=Hibiscus syriacus TaxID=106335 RepID=A0A6A2XXC4_HIBSY|nr:hypothetical protein F3Y22_tig00111718pilonHSYRG00052 [Hibiscus syriacus]
MECYKTKMAAESVWPKVKLRIYPFPKRIVWEGVYTPLPAGPKGQRFHFSSFSSLSLLSSFPHQREAGHRPAAVCRHNPHRRPPHPLPIGANLGKYLRFLKVFGDTWRLVVTPIEVLSSPANRGFIALSRRSYGGNGMALRRQQLECRRGAAENIWSDSWGLLEAAAAGTWP